MTNQKDNNLLAFPENYLQEDFESVKRRYSGFGKAIYQKLNETMPFVFENLTFYRNTASQPGDSYAIFTKDNQSFAIQLDPLCEVIVLWTAEIQVEIGTWSSDPYKESIEFIKTKLIPDLI